MTRGVDESQKDRIQTARPHRWLAPIAISILLLSGLAASVFGGPIEDVDEAAGDRGLTQDEAAPISQVNLIWYDSFEDQNTLFCDPTEETCPDDMWSLDRELALSILGNNFRRLTELEDDASNTQDALGDGFYSPVYLAQSVAPYAPTVVVAENRIVPPNFPGPNNGQSFMHVSHALLSGYGSDEYASMASPVINIAGVEEPHFEFSLAGSSEFKYDPLRIVVSDESGGLFYHITDVSYDGFHPKVNVDFYDLESNLGFEYKEYTRYSVDLTPILDDLGSDQVRIWFFFDPDMTIENGLGWSIDDVGLRNGLGYAEEHYAADPDKRLRQCNAIESSSTQGPRCVTDITLVTLFTEGNGEA